MHLALGGVILCCKFMKGDIIYVSNICVRDKNDVETCQKLRKLV